MTTVMEKGTQGNFIEIEASGTVRRFVIPVTDNIESRLSSLLRGKTDLAIVRSGLCNILSPGPLHPFVKMISNLPSTCTEKVDVDFIGNHPFINQGSCYYSKEFHEALLASPVSQAPVEYVEQGQASVYDYTAPIERPVQSVASNPLTEQLKKQVEAPSSVSTLTSVPPKNDIQEKFNKQIEQKRSTTQPVILPHATSIPKAPSSLPETPVQQTPAASTTPPVEQKKATTLGEALKKQREGLAPSTTQPLTYKQPGFEPKGKLDVLLEQMQSLHHKMDERAKIQPMTGQQLKLYLESNIEEYGEEEAYEVLASFFRF